MVIIGVTEAFDAAAGWCLCLGRSTSFPSLVRSCSLAGLKLSLMDRNLTELKKKNFFRRRSRTGDGRVSEFCRFWKLSRTYSSSFISKEIKFQFYFQRNKTGTISVSKVPEIYFQKVISNAYVQQWWHRRFTDFVFILRAFFFLQTGAGINILVLLRPWMTSVLPQPSVCMCVCVDQSSSADHQWIDSIIRNLEIFSRFFHHLLLSLIFTSLWPLLPFDLSQHGGDTLSNLDFTPFCHVSAI